MSIANNTIKSKKNQYHHLKEKDKMVIQTLVIRKTLMAIDYLITLILLII